MCRRFISRGLVLTIAISCSTATAKYLSPLTSVVHANLASLALADAFELGLLTNIAKYSNIGYSLESNLLAPISDSARLMGADINVYKERFHKHTISYSHMIHAMQQNFWTIDFGLSYLSSSINREGFTTITGDRQAHEDSRSVKMALGGASWLLSRVYSKLALGYEYFFQTSGDRYVTEANLKRIYFRRNTNLAYVEFLIGWII